MSAQHKPVVIFGDGTFAEMIAYLIMHDAGLSVAAFTVDKAFKSKEVLSGLPVVDFEKIAQDYPPEQYDMLVALGYIDNNRLRERKCEEAKALGYSLISYISSRASIWPDLKVGENSIIFEHAVVQPFARIGENVIVRSSAHVSHHVEIGSHSFVSASVAIGGNCKVGNHAFIGLNATIRDNIYIGAGGFIAAGAVVSRSTEENGLYMGVPARLVPKAGE